LEKALKLVKGLKHTNMQFFKAGTREHPNPGVVKYDSVSAYAREWAHATRGMYMQRVQFHMRDTKRAAVKAMHVLRFLCETRSAAPPAAAGSQGVSARASSELEHARAMYPTAAFSDAMALKLWHKRLPPLRGMLGTGQEIDALLASGFASDAQVRPLDAPTVQIGDEAEVAVLHPSLDGDVDGSADTVVSFKYLLMLPIASHCEHRLQQAVKDALSAMDTAKQARGMRWYTLWKDDVDTLAEELHRVTLQRRALVAQDVKGKTPDTPVTRPRKGTLKSASKKTPKKACTPATKRARSKVQLRTVLSTEESVSPPKMVKREE